MPKRPLVAVYHPELDATAWVTPTAVRVLAKSGWTALDDERDEDQLELDFDADVPGAPDADKE